ncbi:C40 family peptidase [Bacillus sp. FJAT-25509]|uniref:C40 family peptidase n=1 Tax=Bacillus sp. FJAT-25509 TaxID=1712029 RepID=UPI0006F3441A|nr:C40 family peptidase [Bacillus sp. FJAT-25509]
MKKKIIQSIAIIGSVSCINSMDLLEADAESTTVNQPKASISYVDYYISTGNGVRIRSGAGTNYSILGSVNKNAKLDVISSTNGWYKINYKGRMGYISGTYVKKQSSNVENEKIENNTSNYISTGNGVRIRSGAGTNYSILGSVNKNAKLDVKSSANGWYKIIYQGRIGYISGTYVQKQKNIEDENPVYNTTKYIVTGARVNIRSGAGTNYNIIGSATKMQKLDVISTSNGWRKINYQGKIGYISAGYTEKEIDQSNGSTSDIDEQNMISFAKQFLGVPYKWAGVSPTGFDCSGFIYYVLKENGKPFGRTNVSGYWQNNTSFQKVTTSQPGDLIFFQNTYTYGPSHMGIMLNQNEFIQAGTSKGVTISNLNDSYWQKHFLGYKRIKS